MFHGAVNYLKAGEEKCLGNIKIYFVFPMAHSIWNLYLNKLISTLLGADAAPCQCVAGCSVLIGVINN